VTVQVRDSKLAGRVVVTPFVTSPR
jgi:hypothetical protein